MSWGVIAAIVGIFAVGLAWLFRRGAVTEPPALAAMGEPPKDSIFVALPCYRDGREAGRAIRSLRDKATLPNRVFVGVCHYTSKRHGDDDPLEEARRGRSETWFDTNVRSYAETYPEATGVATARARIERLLFRNETFVLHVDCHTLFRQGWDAALINDLEHAETTFGPKVLLTAPLPEHEIADEAAAEAPPAFAECSEAQKITSNFYVPVCTRKEFAEVPSQFYASPVVHSQFVFARAALFRAAPHPLIPWIVDPYQWALSGAYAAAGFAFLTARVSVASHCERESSRRGRGLRRRRKAPRDARKAAERFAAGFRFLKGFDMATGKIAPTLRVGVLSPTHPLEADRIALGSRLTHVDLEQNLVVVPSDLEIQEKWGNVAAYTQRFMRALSLSLK